MSGSRPHSTPLGLRVTRSARVVERAFNAAMVEAGGSASLWTILIACKSRNGANQRELAASVGIRQATLTHHLDAMEERGLLERRSDPRNRRVHIIELTPAGDQMFHTLREAAAAFDHDLRRGLSTSDQETFESVLDTLVANVDARQ